MGGGGDAQKKMIKDPPLDRPQEVPPQIAASIKEKTIPSLERGNNGFN